VSGASAAGDGASWWREAVCLGWVRDRLMHFRWSPEQISAGLKLMHPEDSTCQVSHETNNGGDPRGGLKAVMVEALRQHKPRRGLRRTPPSGGALLHEPFFHRDSPGTLALRAAPAPRGARKRPPVAPEAHPWCDGAGRALSGVSAGREMHECGTFRFHATTPSGGSIPPESLRIIHRPEEIAGFTEAD